VGSPRLVACASEVLWSRLSDPAILSRPRATADRGTFLKRLDRQGGACEGTRTPPGFIPHDAGGGMGRRVNYGFEKRQREIKKQKKNEEKAERKRQEAMDRAEQRGADAAAEDAPKGD